jgi:Icc protein
MITLNRRKLLSAMAATTVSAAIPSDLFAVDDGSLASRGKFTFIFFTDSHTQPELNAAEGTAMAYRAASKIKADFAIQGGDLVFDAAAVSKQRAVSLFDLYGKVEQDLSMKVYHTIGNHDVVGMGASEVSSSDPFYGKRLFEERFGTTYYSFDHKGHHFIVLDSIQYHPEHNFEGRIGPEQLEWLSSDLNKQPTGTPIIIAVHIPLATSALSYVAAPETKNAAILTVRNSAEVIALFEGHNVLGVLQGHTHLNEVVTWKGVPYITSGAISGNWWRGSRLGIPEGFTVVDIADGRLTTRYETYGFKSVAPAEGMGFK